jgi:SsrA-binding protein
MHYKNRNATNYSCTEKFEAGIALTGAEVKSLRTQGISFTDSKVLVKGSEVTLENVHIAPYKYATQSVTDSTRSRPLLLNHSQIKKLLSYQKQKYAIYPIAIYQKGRWIKTSIGVGKRLKKFEKRKIITDRDQKRQIQARLKQSR